ncbi:MAG: tetratricopeptide repeat protein, partial [Candidatus Angelobacter sp.]
MLKCFRKRAFLLALLPLAWVSTPGQATAGSDLKAQLEKANSAYQNHDADQAQKIYDVLLPQLRLQGPGQDLAEALTNSTDLAISAGEYDRAVALALEHAGVCKQLGDSLGEARAHNDAGLAYSDGGKYAAAAAELELALRLNGPRGDSETAVLILNNLGNVDYYQARYSEALRIYDSAMEYVQKAGQQQWAMSWERVTRLNIATLYQRLGNDKRAIAVYHEVSDSPLGLSPREIAHVLANLGILYRHLGDAQEALKNYHDAERWYGQEKDTDGELGVLKNIGIVLALDLNRPRDALRIFDRSLALAETTKNQREAMQARLYRGETLDLMGRQPEAEQEFNTALALAVKLGAGEEQWKALYALGRIAQSRGHVDLAEQKFREAVATIEGLRSKLQLTRLKSDFLADKRDVYDALITLLLRRNDTAAAVEYI